MNIVNRIIASFCSCVVHPWQTNNYEKTADGKRLATYKNRYKGQRCFLIGNGPSLKAEDLTKLHQAGEITFAFNRVYNIFEDTPWRPTFYISQDEKMLAGSADIVSALPLDSKFIPIQLNWWHNIHIDNATHFNIINRPAEDPMEMDFSDDIAHGIYNSATVMYTAAQMAAYMGFSEIYLIGVDHHFHISRNNNGEIVVDDSVKDYFSDKYNEDKANLYIPNTEKSTLTYYAMKDHCESRGIQVLNATRGGKLEVFKRIEFESLFD